MNTWKVKAGTTVLVQGYGEYVLKKDLNLYREITEPLRQFPNEIVKASFDAKASKFFAASPTALFLLREEWPAHPNHVVAVHRRDLYYTMNVYRCRKCNAILRVDGSGQLKLVCPSCGATYEFLYEGDSKKAAPLLEKEK